jgi:hypothetical protein
MNTLVIHLACQPVASQHSHFPQLPTRVPTTLYDRPLLLDSATSSHTSLLLDLEDHPSDHLLPHAQPDAQPIEASATILSPTPSVLQFRGRVFILSKMQESQIPLDTRIHFITQEGEEEAKVVAFWYRDLHCYISYLAEMNDGSGAILLLVPRIVPWYKRLCSFLCLC